MLNIDEIVIYLILIVAIICGIQIYNKMYPKLQPIWEGLNEDDSGDTPAEDKKPPKRKENANGYNSGSADYNQDLSGLIAVNEIELDINKYSEDYIDVLTTLKEYYARRALKALLSPVLSSSMYNTNFMGEANLFNAGIATIDNLIPLIKKIKKSPTVETESDDKDTKKSGASSSWSPW